MSNQPLRNNGKLTNTIKESYSKVQKSYRLSFDNILEMIPLWLANCYCFYFEDYTEKEVIMKTGDKGKEYKKDKEFLTSSFIWAGITEKNLCMSNERIKNMYCFNQKTFADDVLDKLKLKECDKMIYSKWIEILNIAQSTDEYNENWTYGLNQIIKEINVKSAVEHIIKKVKK